MKPEKLAQLFHEIYENLAPVYGYQTRGRTKVPWDKLPKPNKSLMIATAREILNREYRFSLQPSRAYRDLLLRDMDVLLTAILEENLTAILEENDRQLDKWGVQTYTIFQWITFVLEEVGEMATAVSESEFRGASRRKVFEEAIQAATLLLKIAEMFQVEDTDFILKEESNDPNQH